MRPGSLLASRLRLRPDVLFSRPLLRGPAVVHLIKDPRTGRAFEVGPREHFLMSRLDGERTLAGIGEEYAAAFGRRLAESNWLQLVTLLGSRGLLAVPDKHGPGRDDPGQAAPGTEPATGSATVRAVQAAYRLLRTGLSRPDPPARGTSKLDPDRLVLPALAALAVGAVAFLCFHLGELLDGAGWLVRHPLPLIAAVAVVWASAALHELGHGVAALWHDCRVTKVSVATLHCQVDGYLYLRSIPAQLVIAGVGGLVNALVLLPMTLVWAVLPSGAGSRAWLGGVLFFGLVQTLLNYLPLPPLDGYRMLSHALGAADLATGSQRFLRLALARTVWRWSGRRWPGRPGPGIAAYPTRARLIYAGYGVASLALTAGLLAGTLLVARALADRRFGALGVVITIVAVSMTIAGWLARPARKKTPPEEQDRSIKKAEIDDRH